VKTPSGVDHFLGKNEGAATGGTPWPPLFDLSLLGENVARNLDAGSRNVSSQECD
jgi:hypothetical protein